LQEERILEDGRKGGGKGTEVRTLKEERISKDGRKGGGGRISKTDRG